MPQLKSSTVTVFAEPAPVRTDPARDIVAAVYAWGRIAVPVPDPVACAVAWCFNCQTGSAATIDEDSLYHHSAAATVEAISCNGADTDVDKLTIDVWVERIEYTDDLNQPATAVLRFGNGDFIDLSRAKAAEVSAALTKARTSAEGLAARGTVDEGATGAVSVVRTGNGTLQVGALHTADGPVVFINVLTVLTAADVREIARREGVSYPPDSYDLTPADAAHLAAAVDAAAVLAAADRAALAVSS